jgi:hypothetical protein
MVCRVLKPPCRVPSAVLHNVISQLAMVKDWTHESLTTEESRRVIRQVFMRSLKFEPTCARTYRLVSMSDCSRVNAFNPNHGQFYVMLKCALVCYYRTRHYQIMMDLLCKPSQRHKRERVSELGLRWCNETGDYIWSAFDILQQQFD